jgi:hypothetical protein
MIILVAIVIFQFISYLVPGISLSFGRRAALMNGDHPKGIADTDSDFPAKRRKSKIKELDFYDVKMKKKVNFWNF